MAHPLKSISLLTHYLGIKLCLTVPCRSIVTTLYTFDSLNSLMEMFITLYLIPLTRITDKEPGSPGIYRYIGALGCPRFLRCDPTEGLFIFQVCDRSLFISLSMQNTQVSETREFRKSYGCECVSKHDLKGLSIPVSCYRGALATPKWKDVDPRESFFFKI